MKTLQDVNIILIFFSLGCITVVAVAAEETIADRAKYGRLVGDITTKQFDVKGTVYAVDNSKLFIRGFFYNGGGIDPYFYIKNRGSSDLTTIPYPIDSSEYLGKNTDENIVLALPEGQDVSNIESLYLRSRTNSGDEGIYGEITFHSDLLIPIERKIGKFTELDHDVKSGKVIIKDAKTLFIPKFYYDGKAPQAYFFVGNSTSRKNPKTQIADESGSYAPIQRKHNGEDITVKLPGDLNVFNIKWLSMWCVKYSVEFGHVDIPSPNELNVPPYTGKKIAPPPTESSKLMDSSGANFLRSNFILCSLTISSIAFTKI